MMKATQSYMEGQLTTLVLVHPHPAQSWVAWHTEAINNSYSQLIRELQLWTFQNKIMIITSFL
jgi:hypothetical protein